MEAVENLHFEEEEEIETPEEVEPIFEVIKDFPDYEISNNIYPFIIRRISNKKIISVSDDQRGYYKIHLNGNRYKLHRIIAKQFIPNPENLPEVDHKNHNGKDNRIENLRWVSSSTNNQNRAGFKGVKFNYVNELSDDAIDIESYGKHEFEFYYFDDNKFYFYNGVAFRELNYLKDKDGLYFVCVRNTSGKQTKIYLNRPFLIFIAEFSRQNVNFVKQNR